MRFSADGHTTGSPSPVTVGVDVGAIALSKDDTRLAYTKVTHVTSNNHLIEAPTVSSDGEWIAFDSNRSGNMDIWMMRKDGSRLKQLTTDEAHDFAPRFSPDAKQLAFYSLHGGNRDIYLLSVAGGTVKPLASHPADDRYPVWSPDGD